MISSSNNKVSLKTTDAKPLVTQAKRGAVREKLDEIEWIFNNVDDAGLDMTKLKSGVMSALRNTDKTPIKELDDIFLDQSKVDKLKNLFNVNITDSEDIIQAVSNNFEKIFVVIE